MMMLEKKPFPEKLKPITEVIYEILVEVLTLQREMHSNLEVLKDQLNQIKTKSGGNDDNKS